MATGEIAARALYQEAATHCQSVKDYVSRDLFESLMKDEEHHIDFLETQLDLIQRIGLELRQVRDGRPTHISARPCGSGDNVQER